MNAYKLFRVKKDGSLGSLFIGRDLTILKDRWMTAETNLPHPGLAHRPGFHCCAKMTAPHIKLKLKSGEIRVWRKVEIEDYETIVRPASQGGVWFIAKQMLVHTQ